MFTELFCTGHIFPKDSLNSLFIYMDVTLSMEVLYAQHLLTNPKFKVTIFILIGPLLFGCQRTKIHIVELI